MMLIDLIEQACLGSPVAQLVKQGSTSITPQPLLPWVHEQREESVLFQWDWSLRLKRRERQIQSGGNVHLL